SDAATITQTVLEHTLVSQATASVSGSLAVSFGADGPAAAGTPVNPGTGHTFNFDELTNGSHTSITEGTFTIATNQGVANTTGLHGEIYGTNIGITNGGTPFELNTIDLGLFGTGTKAAAENVTLTGVDIHGNTITDTVNIGATVALGSPLTFTFNASGTPFDGVELTSLHVTPVLGNNNGGAFNGSVVIDNLGVTTGMAPAVPGPIAFTDLATAINNVSIVDDHGNAVSAATLTSHGQQVHYELLDSATLVGYTGSAPTTTTASNVVFSVVLSQDPTNNPNGGYTFTLDKPLDDLPASVTDLKFTFGFTATDFDGDTAPGHFSVDVHDDTPSDAATITQTVLEHTLVSQATASVSGSLAVSFGADGPAAAGTPVNPGTGHTFNFDELTN